MSRELDWTPQDEALIRHIYEIPDRATIRERTAKVRPRLTHKQAHQIHRKAMRMGLALPYTTQRPWNDPAELVLLERHAHKNPMRIRQIFKAAGYERSAAGIGLKLRREFGTQQDLRLGGGVFTAAGAAQVVGVTTNTVLYWIGKGMLKSKPGAQRGRYTENLIKSKDLRDFCMRHTAHVNLQKADKYLLFDVLCPGFGEKECPDSVGIEGLGENDLSIGSL